MMMERQRLRNKAMFTTFLVFPLVFYYMSPVLILMGASEGIVNGSAIFFAGLFVSSLFFGRAWCGWLCPAGGLQEQCSKVRDKRAKGGWRNHVKWFVWAPWIVMVLYLFMRAGGVIDVDPGYQTWYGISINSVGSVLMFLMIAGAIAAMALLVGRRAFCHYLCWMAPFMIIGAKVRDALSLPGVRLSSDVDKCMGCGKCSRNCPMGLEVQEMVEVSDMRSSECVLCGSCVDGCPRGAICIKSGRPAGAGSASGSDGVPLSSH
jgi:ferredoxin-type protein NapH